MIDHLNTLQDLCKKERYRVAVALSGGIDSTASAIILKEKGYEVIGLSMYTYDSSLGLPSGIKACFGPLQEENIEYVRYVCKRLGILLHIVDLRKEFRELVIEYFRREYLSGRTPNPCVRCNEKIKFDLLFKRAKEKIEVDLFATGHHARIERKGERYCLRKAYDKRKDQSYFLYRLRQDQLSKIIFPAGGYKKDQLRNIVSSYGIEIRRESQDFISGRSYDVLFKKDEIRKGPILDKDGNIIGRHKGIIYYTVGQRRGIGISSKRPLYVIEIDAKRNSIVVGHKEDTYSKGLIAREVNLICPDISFPAKAKVKIRQQHREADAVLYPIKNGIKVTFEDKQMAVTPGQSAVFYKEDTVLGGGIIESPIRE